MKMQKGKRVGAALLAAALMTGSAMANTYGFYSINGTAPDVAQQLKVNITSYATPPGAAEQVQFEFLNEGPLSSSITEIYFDDGTLLGISQILNGPGVSFSQGEPNGVNPSNLPGGNIVVPAFVATQEFSSEADGNNTTGIQPGEYVKIIFDLINGKTFADTITAMGSGELRIGLHVRSIGLTGFSESFVNGEPPSVPDAASTIMLLGMALLGVEGYRRKTIR